MPKGIQLTTEFIGGVEVQIYVTARGQFQAAMIDGTRLGWGNSLADAIATARTSLAKQKVRVSTPFITRAGERGVATGLHATTGAVLARIDDKPAQLADYSDRRVFAADIPPEKLARYIELDEQARVAKAEMHRIEQEFGFDIAQVVKREVEAKGKEAADAQS